MQFIIALILVQSCKWSLCTGEDNTLNEAEISNHPENLRRSHQEDYPTAHVSDDSGMIRPIILDLAHVDPQGVKKATVYIGRTETTDYVVYQDTLIVKIIDGKETVWTGGIKYPCKSAKLISRGDEYKHLTVFIGKGRDSQYRYFEKDGYNWKEFTKEEHNNRFGARKKKEIPTRNVELEEDPPFILDIEIINDPRVIVDESMESGIRRRSYREVDSARPVSTSNVTFVVAGNFTFWEQKNFEVLKGCDEYYKDSHRLLYIRVDSLGPIRRLFFEKSGKQWRNINKNEFEILLETMRKDEEELDLPESMKNEEAFKKHAEMEKQVINKSRKIGKGGNTVEMISQSMKERDLFLAAKKLVNGLSTLDIAKPDQTATDISGMARDGIVELTLSPKDEGFTTVKYGDHVLWTSERRGEECIGVQVRSRENTTFIRIRVMVKGRSVFFHFKNSENDWVEVSEGEFSTTFLNNRKGDAEPKVSQENPSGFCTSSIALLVATILLYTL